MLAGSIELGVVLANLPEVGFGVLLRQKFELRGFFWQILQGSLGLELGQHLHLVDGLVRHRQVALRMLRHVFQQLLRLQGLGGRPRSDQG